MKNHLFIGLGGQGGKSIAELRKTEHARSNDAKLLNSEGVMWDFFYIDSSPDVISNRSNWTHFGENLSLSDDSYFRLNAGVTTSSPGAMRLRPDIAPWIGDEQTLASCFEDDQDPGVGANQKRRFGRLLFASHVDRIRNRIDKKVTPLLRKSHQCAFHIFASLAGGTGSGCIVDLVTTLRSKYTNSSIQDGFPIFLYLYVTSRENKKAQVGYFHENQLASLRDLNALCCGKFKPTLLGDDRPEETFSGSEPITQIVLSSDINERNQYVDIDKQHKIIAEAAFERIYAYSSKSLNEDQQKSLTGEDKLKNFKGEPDPGLERTFRFASLGMKRWEVPTDEIRELLANELYSSAFRQMTHQNWNEETGYANLPLPNNGEAGIDQLVSLLKNAIERNLVEKQNLPDYIGSIDRDLENAFTGIQRDKFSQSDLSSIEDRFKDRYYSHFMGLGVERAISNLSTEKSARIENIRESIHEILTDSWSRTSKPIGMAYIPTTLRILQSQIRERIQSPEQIETDDSALGYRMEARKHEWNKLTTLSGLFKRTELARAHLSDIRKLISSDLRRRCLTIDSEIYNLLIRELGSIEQAYHGALTKLEKWSAKSDERRKLLSQDLRNLNHETQTNMYEVSSDILERYVKAQNTCQPFLLNFAEQIRFKGVIHALGRNKLDGLGNLSKESESIFWEKAEVVAYSFVEQIHQHLVERDKLKPILTSSLMTTLQERYNSDPEQLEQQMRSFIAQASCSIQIDVGQTQPKTLMQRKAPTMPDKIMAVGLPEKHEFSQTIQKLISPLLPSDDDVEPGFYFHDDPTQIRLLVSRSWMAARFATVVQQLDQQYNRSIGRNFGGEVCYFSNIDEDGQKGRRPPLLLPDEASLRSICRATLWLGQRIEIDPDGTKMIHVTTAGVALMSKSQTGISSENIGESIEIIEKTANLVLISRLSGAVKYAINEINPDTRNDLKLQLEVCDQNLRKSNDPGGEVYRQWSFDRDKIHEMLGQ